MKPIHYLSLFLLFLLAACQDEENQSCSVSIQLTAPDDYPELAFDGMKVTLTSKSGQGTTYTTISSPTGIATFNVEYGEYSASVHHQTPAGVIFNGRVENILLSPEKGDITDPVELELSRAQTNALVIKEIYYGGCKDKEGEEYNLDQYVTLYNNSDEVIYLDGLCVATVDPTTNRKASPWIKENPDMALIPICDFTWQFPGTGTKYPLAPGAETTIAANAVDHTGGAYGHPQSVNLSKVDWAFYDQSLKRQAIPTLGVTPLKMLLRTNPNTLRYGIADVGPAFIVFSLQAPQGAEAYVRDPANRKPQPGGNITGLTYLMIPRQWIIDCIDCVESGAQQTFNRVPTVLDHKPAYMPDGLYRGTSLLRKQASPKGDGYSVYQDTNNSSEDLTARPASLKSKP